MNAPSRSVMAGQAAAASADVEFALQPIPDRHAAAFFDVDNTLMQGASIFHLARGLYRRKFFTTADIAKAAWQQAYFRIAGVEDPEHIAQARSSALEFIEGHSASELRQIGEEIFDEYMAARVWPGTRAIAAQHLDRGQRVWLVTAAPVEIAAVIADRLGLTGALGTVAEQHEGIYTGRLVGEMLHGSGKAVAVQELAAQQGLDLNQCYAYSDSANDLPMLQTVGHPCVINPDRTLHHVAKERGWRIREYRTKRRVMKVTAAAALAAVSGVFAWRLAIRSLRARMQGLDVGFKL